jgi:predicted nucleic acid-binding protein
MQPAMRAVLDTNVWLDWLVFDDPSVVTLRLAVAAGALRLVANRHARDELAEVLARPTLRAQALAARARRANAAPLVDPLGALAEFDALVLAIEAREDCGLRCSDPADQPFIDVAVACGARWLLSKDRALLSLAARARARFGLSIVVPARFEWSAGAPAQNAR